MKGENHVHIKLFQTNGDSKTAATCCPHGKPQMDARNPGSGAVRIAV
jgi:hypothetical protein